jgi:RNA polymerase sigma-54 factor
MNNSLHTGLRQSHKLVITQFMQQTIKLLQLSTIELYEKISQELSENPVLEGEYSGPLPTAQGDDCVTDSNRNLSGEDPDFSSSDEAGSDISDASGTVTGNGKDSGRRKEYPGTAIIREETLAEHLMSQAHLMARTEKELNLFETIITSLNQNGFLNSDPGLLAGEGNPDPELERTVSAVQLLDPVGCGVSGVRESLIVQCRYFNPQDTLLICILKEHFEDFEKLNYSKIAKSLDLPEDIIAGKCGIIRNLNPYPGRQYSNGAIRYIIHDVDVKLVDNEIIISVNDDWVPAVRISKYYVNLLKKKNTEKKARDYIQDKMRSANVFIKAIAGRRNTISIIIRAIMEHQRDFLVKGPGHLKPLTCREIAEAVRMHESTVSRATCNKYVQTSWGVFDLKDFFVSQTKEGGAGPNASADKVKRLMRDIVGQENPARPCSDEEIVAILKKAGVRVARRTVAKYREMMDIPPAHKRKKINKYKTEELS